jgi:DNA-binding response OmpR family regulator
MSISKQKVFVVDDERQIADLVSRYLRAAQFDVETFYDARSALLRANDCLPDILISDIVMPDMDGVTLANTLRLKNPSCKVVLTSGNPDWKIRADGLDGFTLLPKPFSLKELLPHLKPDLF